MQSIRTLKSVGTSHTCSTVIPVKQNIPIWSVMWVQDTFDPLFCNSLRRACLISIILMSGMANAIECSD